MEVKLKVGESKVLKASVVRGGRELPPPGLVSWTLWAPPGVASLVVNPDHTATVTGLAEGAAGCSAAVYQWPAGWVHWATFGVVVGEPSDSFVVSEAASPTPT